MRFSAFIEQNLDAIAAEWEAFARTLLPAAKMMSDLTLRDHCREISLGHRQGHGDEPDRGRADVDRSK